jgi:GNAT superfamily N-acetyltransferase
MSSTTKQPLIHVRQATLAEQPSIARLAARGFHDDVLFGHIIHPYRHAYPSHMSRYWLSRNLMAHFDPGHRINVAIAVPSAYDSHEKRIVGVIHWSRIAPSPADNYAAGWGYSWWHAGQILHFLVANVVWLAYNTIWRNRAADPAHERIIEASEASGCLDHIWDPARNRCPSWYIESMAVDPDWQGKGVGRLLVEDGLKLAESEGVSASVIAADGKEDFYRKCGFDTGPVGRSGMGDDKNNPLRAVPGGLVFFKEAPGKRMAVEIEDKEVDECVRWLRRDLEKGWRSSWLETGAGRDLGREAG